MENALIFIKKMAFKALAYVPKQLPKTPKEFEDYFTYLFEVYQFPINDSYYHAVATMIMNQSPVTDKIPPAYFVKGIRKAMANEIAYAKLESFRLKKKEELQKAAAAAANQSTEPQSEVTGVPV